MMPNVKLFEKLTLIQKCYMYNNLRKIYDSYFDKYMGKFPWDDAVNTHRY